MCIFMRAFTLLPLKVRTLLLNSISGLGLVVHLLSVPLSHN